ncbi:MAG: alpha-galactosidase [Gemmatimonadales bacterium]|jgi:hypothetical protein
MRRRDLLAALAAGLLWRPAPRGGSPRRARAPWTFRLDRSGRWTLADRDGRAVVAGAEIAVTLGGGAPVSLAALEHVRQFRLAEAHGASAGWQVVGAAQGVEVSAQFLDGPPPLVAVTARGLEDERSLEEIRFFDTGTAQIPALVGRPVAWINGYLSSDPCHIAVLGSGTAAASHWSLAILSGPSAHATAFAFGVDDSGEGRFDCAAGRVVAASRFRGRTVGAIRAPATAALTILPTSQPLDALGMLAGGPAPVRTDIPAGWSVGATPSATATEADVLAALDAARAAFRPALPLVVRIGDGYQRSAGDWETNDAFPHGHRWLTDRIHAAGFRAGLWLAPLLVAERSGIPAAHPDWLLETPGGDALVVDESAERGGRVYALDAAQAPVRDYLRDLMRHSVAEWGYDDLTLDQLRYGAVASPARGGMSRSEACRAALRALREGAGGAFVTACDVPLQPAAGLVDAVRHGPSADRGFVELHQTARAIALRAHYRRTVWLNDPGALDVGEPMTRDEARLWATVVAFAGGPSISGQAPDRLSPERLEVLQRAMPVAPLQEREYDLAPDASAAAAPAWLLGRIAEGWWMLAALNWGETPQRFTFSLASHGIRGALAAYDVWSEQRRGDVDGEVVLSIAPRSTVVLSLRRRRRTPAVIGSTRHVVQGLDLRSERWDAGRRTLAAQAVQLDGRPYAVAIALPPGFTPRRASSDPGVATVAVTGSGALRAARLELASPPGSELSWEVEFG